MIIRMLALAKPPPNLQFFCNITTEIFSEIKYDSYISELIKNKWIQAEDSIDNLERQVCDFFGVSSLDEILQLNINFRCSEYREPEATSRIAWVKRVENTVTR